MARFVLENNNFKFNRKANEQSLVLAIGTKFAPPYPLYLLILLREVSSNPPYICC